LLPFLEEELDLVLRSMLNDTCSSVLTESVSELIELLIELT
jgi:hypothetical protein